MCGIVLCFNGLFVYFWLFLGEKKGECWEHSHPPREVVGGRRAVRRRIDAGHSLAIREALVASGPRARGVARDGVPYVGLRGRFARRGEALLALHAHFGADFECVLVAAHEGELPAELALLGDEASDLLLRDPRCVLDAVGEDDDGRRVYRFVLSIAVDKHFEVFDGAMDTVAQGRHSVGSEEVRRQLVDLFDGFVEEEFADGVVEVVYGDADVALGRLLLLVDEVVDALDGLVSHRAHASGRVHDDGDLLCGQVAVSIGVGLGLLGGRRSHYLVVEVLEHSSVLLVFRLGRMQKSAEKRLYIRYTVALSSFCDLFDL